MDEGCRFTGTFRFFEYNSFERSGKTALLELVFENGIYHGWLRQSDRYDTTENFPENHAVKGYFNQEKDCLEIGFSRRNQTETFYFREEDDLYTGNFPGDDAVWSEWEKLE